MTPEQIERNRQFLRDLRANPRKAKGCMRDKEGGRCCLQVAVDTVEKLTGRTGGICELSTFFDWRVENWTTNLIKRNDGIQGFTELSHPEIADLFEDTFPELKQP